MNTWNVFITGRARKQLLRMPERIQSLFEVAVEDMKREGAAPDGWDVKQIGADEFRLRLTYRYRIRYRVVRPKGTGIEVFYIGHRRDAYR